MQCNSRKGWRRVPTIHFVTDENVLLSGSANVAPTLRLFNNEAINSDMKVTFPKPRAASSCISNKGGWGGALATKCLLIAAADEACAKQDVALPAAPSVSAALLWLDDDDAHRRAAASAPVARMMKEPTTG